MKIKKSLNMTGPLDFDSNTVDREVESDRVGNYALGYLRNNNFQVRYVGRSDNKKLKGRIKQHLREADSKHSKFKFSYADSVREAFEKECRNYHDFKPPENKIHPDRPDHTDWPCPIQSCNELE
jgi:hypothetical protein